MVNWIDALRKERLIAEVMKRTTLLTSNNALGQTSQQQVIRAMGWVPANLYFSLENIVDRMNKERFRAQQVVLSRENDFHGSPPTYFETNKFTSGFQAIVDTYGMPRYQEVNPGLFTIVTFPFLFGVMYGDMLHATLLLCFAIYLLVNEKKLLYEKKIGKMGEMFGMAFGGRYIIFMMALFGIYAGTLYNDAASIPLNVFGSRWNFETNTMNEDGPYPWGVDPEWYGKKNELVFLNSLKMKLSIILGVSQMLFGICLGLANNLHFKDYAGIFFEFFPRILFMLCTFGYMAILIIFKWCTDWTTADIAAPNLIQTMIGMFLKPGSLKPEETMYSGQKELQIFMLLLAVACVPAMLLGKPLMANAEFKKKYGGQSRGRHGHVNSEEEHKVNVAHEVESEGGHGEVGPNYSFSDHMITQSIHTIEFVLGAVSNTASYLRLWALSLAHAQLATVFWSKMMMDYGITNGPFFAFIGFAAWAGATTAVLLCMDVLECFLHALRLHWVEFQNKFFFADGYAFEPFSFKNLEED
jgi:V-type H+-transporting ATPase subunit a